MLKTDIIESGKQIRFILHGKLFEPWVSGLRVIWEEKQKSLGACEVVVDLREMTAVDLRGIELLSHMHESGARFLSSGVLTRFVVESLRKKRSKNWNEAVPQ